MRYFSVDKIEEKYVECEDSEGRLAIFSKKDVPRHIREGDILNFAKDGKLIVNKVQTEKVRSSIKDIYGKILDQNNT